MFTGIITHIQKYIFLENNLTFSYNDFWYDVNLGDSIAVNGICLTVCEINKEFIHFQISEETFKKTNVSSGNTANVEKSSIIGERNSGHDIFGHVHGICVISSIIENENSNYDIWIEVDKQDSYKLFYKDSVSVNGVSLTIAEILNNKFKISMINHTWKNTTFLHSDIGDICNIEFNNKIVSDEDIMKIALQESNLHIQKCNPNPHVGCVITCNNQILSKGTHKIYGNKHAEAIALQELKHHTGCTLYCTLEPCCHIGKQPACTSAIIESKKISKVVIGILDPDENVAGKGKKILEEAGIEVISGILKNDIEHSLRGYIHNRKNNKTYMIGKLAVSNDNVYALPNKNMIISSEIAKIHAHSLREFVNCILIGAQTLLIDNPTLDLRNGSTIEQLPAVVILDSKNKITHTNFKCFNNRKVIIFGETDRHFESETIEYIKFNLIDEIPKLLSQKGMLTCLVEGGGKTIDLFIEHQSLDEMIIYKSNKNFGYGKQFILHDTQLIAGEYIDNTTMCYISNLTQHSKSEILSFDEIEDALLDYSLGKPIIVMDNEDRENEGDIIVSGRHLTEDIVRLYQNFTSGIMCGVISKLKDLTCLP